MNGADDADRARAREKQGVVMFPVSKIRFTSKTPRRDPGSTDSMHKLAESIRTVGLIHPIIVKSDGELIAGGRRYTAMETYLKWTEVPVRIWDDLAEDERRAVILDENEKRKDLTKQEREQFIEAAREQAKKEEKDVYVPRGTKTNTTKTGPGRSKTGGSARTTAKAGGIGKSTVNRSDRESAILSRFPSLSNWSQNRLLQLDKLIRDNGITDHVVESVLSTNRDPKSAMAQLKELAGEPDETSPAARGAMTPHKRKYVGPDLDQKAVSFDSFPPTIVLQNIVNAWNLTAPVGWDSSPEAMATVDPALVYKALDAINRSLPLLENARNMMLRCWRVEGMGVVRVDPLTQEPAG